MKQYPDDDANYLIQKFLQQGDSCQISGNNYLALQKFEAAQSLNESVNSQIVNETIREKKRNSYTLHQVYSHLNSEELDKEQTISLELVNHYSTQDNRSVLNQFIYRISIFINDIHRCNRILSNDGMLQNIG